MVGRAAGAAQGAALLLLLAEAVGATAYGIPTPATVAALAGPDRAPEALRAAIAPAPTTPG